MQAKQAGRHSMVSPHGAEISVSFSLPVIRVLCQLRRKGALSHSAHAAVYHPSRLAIDKKCQESFVRSSQRAGSRQVTPDTLFSADANAWTGKGVAKGANGMCRRSWQTILPFAPMSSLRLRRGARRSQLAKRRVRATVAVLRPEPLRRARGAFGRRSGAARRWRS